MTWDVTNQERYLYSIDGHHIQMSPVALSVLNEFIEDRLAKLKRPFKLLEFGSGASTPYFMERYPSIEIYSVEGDSNWYPQVKDWISRIKKEGQVVVHEYQEATNYYTSVPDFNINYASCMEKFGPFDLIINDGAMREIVGDYILANDKQFIAGSGMYLRHDYQKALVGDWVGFNKEGRVIPLDYEGFVATHPEYSLITVNGNGVWGYKAEMGGVWRR